MKKLLLFYILFFNGLFSQSNSGTSFHFALCKIPWEKESHVYISIYCDNIAKGILRYNAFEFEKRFALKPGELITIEVPRKVLIDTSETITSKSIEIESDLPIVVNVFNNQEYGSDAFLALPDEVLGTEYMVMCYPGIFPSFTLIVAIEDNTSVKIIENNVQQGCVTLNRGETFLLKSLPNRDLTGTEIHSDRPISIISGNFGAFIPQSDYCCANHLVEMIPPIKQWGRVFFTTPLAMKKNGDIFRILASQDETTIYIDEDSVAQLKKGMYFETNLPSNEGHLIKASKPVLIAQFSTSYQFDKFSKTDPFMTLVQPYEQFGSNYAVIVPEKKAYNDNFLNIAIRTSGVATLRLNNKIIQRQFFSKINDEFSFGQIPITPGGYIVYSIDNSPFSVNVYGYDNYDAYGFVGGTLAKQWLCEKLSKERFLIGVGLSYPFSYGVKFEFGLNHYGLIFSYLYFPEIGKLDDTPPPDNLKKGNYSHVILLSPNYTIPINCDIHFFAGPYFSIAKRNWENNIEGFGFLKGSFFEYYGGIYGGVKYFLFDDIILETSISVGLRSVHRFSDEKIIGSKFSFFPFIGFSYQIF